MLTTPVNHEELFAFIEEQPDHPIAKWATILGVSRSGYYTWKNEREQRMEASEQKTQDVIRIFKTGEGHYGAERICGIIRSEGGHASFYKADRSWRTIS